jgi:Domain of unknown function (DUF4382)
MKTKIYLSVFTVVILALAGWLASCSGSGASAQSAKVNTWLSDPPTCSTTSGGDFSDVFVTISEVEIHQSNAASDTWVLLTPVGMAPKQVDLLGPTLNNCFLAQLGSTTEIPAGTYDQIRITLTPNTAAAASSVAGNVCGASATNCVVVGGVTTELKLSSEANTGLKIPSGQLTGGPITVAVGQVDDIGIDFDACASIVTEGNGGFRLKPVLHAGEANLQANTAIRGKLFDPAIHTGTIPSAHGIVALEQKDPATGIDRVVLQTPVSVDGSGNVTFVFCPVPAGTYDVVAVIETGSGASTVAYAATITSGVQPGADLGNIPMHAQVATTLPGTITGQVTTSATGPALIPEDLSLSALEPMTIGGSPVQVTIPLVQENAAVLAAATVSDPSCPSATVDCLVPPYSFALPAILPYQGTFSAGGTTYTQITAASVNYAIDARAFLASDGVTPTCSSPDMSTSVQTDGATPLTVTSGTTITAFTLAFTGCQ